MSHHGAILWRNLNGRAPGIIAYLRRERYWGAAHGRGVNINLFHAMPPARASYDMAVARK